MKRLIISLPYFIIILVALGLIITDYQNNNRIDMVTSSNLPLVIIDAGHGGFDGGAVASDGTNEKDINLAISLKLSEKLKRAGVEYQMTRADDISTSTTDKKTIRDRKVSDIHNRLKLIEASGDCIFVSVHQNFFKDASCHGAQIFYSPNNEKSKSLGEKIRSEIINNTQPENYRELKECGKNVYLMYHSKVPSVLVECGFLSNENELNLLKSEEYQEKIASAIFAGIINYLNETESQTQ